MATVDEVTGNGPEVAETAVIHTLQLLERICARDESGKRQGRQSTKLVTKQNAWSFMMRAYRAAHVTKLFYIPSVLLGDKALDTGRTRPVRDGVALDGDVLGNKSILQSSKNAASDPGYKMEHP